MRELFFSTFLHLFTLVKRFVPESEENIQVNLGRGGRLEGKGRGREKEAKREVEDVQSPVNFRRLLCGSLARLCHPGYVGEAAVFTDYVLSLSTRTTDHTQNITQFLEHQWCDTFPPSPSSPFPPLASSIF